MSEEILKVFLDDLKTIRVVCQHCNVVVEMEVQSLKTTIRTTKCPQCSQDFFPSAKTAFHPLHELADIFAYLDSVKGKVKIEFPVKIK